jgi:BASS family bile acid:Na+ symporter
MDARSLVVLALQVSIIATVFSFGLNARFADLDYLVRRPGLLARSLIAILVIMPVFAVLLVRLFDIRAAAEIVLVALAISPVPPLLPNRERKGGGRDTYGLALMAILSIVAIVALPIAGEALERVFGRPLGVTPGAVAAIVVKMTLLPLAAGLAIRTAFPALAERVAPSIALVATVLLALAAVVLLAGTWRTIWDAIGGGALIAMIVFVAVGLLVGHVLGGPDPETSVVLALSTACRHPMIALTIASANFPDQRFGALIVLYLLVNVVVGAAYIVWLRQRTTGAVPV